MGIFLFFILLALAYVFVPKYIKFSGSKYQEASGNSFFKTIFDAGNYGEFLTFAKLEKLPGHQKLLTNLYLKKINVTSPDVKVLKRNALLGTIKKEISTAQKQLTNFQIERLNAVLHKFSHADSTVKESHIKQIQLKR